MENNDENFFKTYTPSSFLSRPPLRENNQVNVKNFENASKNSPKSCPKKTYYNYHSNVETECNKANNNEIKSPKQTSGDIPNENSLSICIEDVAEFVEICQEEGIVSERKKDSAKKIEKQSFNSQNSNTTLEKIGTQIISSETEISCIEEIVSTGEKIDTTLKYEIINKELKSVESHQHKTIIQTPVKFELQTEEVHSSNTVTKSADRILSNLNTYGGDKKHNIDEFVGMFEKLKINLNKSHDALFEDVPIIVAQETEVRDEIVGGKNSDEENKLEDLGNVTQNKNEGIKKLNEGINNGNNALKNEKIEISSNENAFKLEGKVGSIENNNGDVIKNVIDGVIKDKVDEHKDEKSTETTQHSTSNFSTILTLESTSTKDEARPLSPMDTATSTVDSTAIDNAQHITENNNFKNNDEDTKIKKEVEKIDKDKTSILFEESIEKTTFKQQEAIITATTQTPSKDQSNDKLTVSPKTPPPSDVINSQTVMQPACSTFNKETTPATKSINEVKNDPQNVDTCNIVAAEPIQSSEGVSEKLLDALEVVAIKAPTQPNEEEACLKPTVDTEVPVQQTINTEVPVQPIIHTVAPLQPTIDTEAPMQPADGPYSDVSLNTSTYFEATDQLESTGGCNNNDQNDFDYKKNYNNNGPADANKENDKDNTCNYYITTDTGVNKKSNENANNTDNYDENNINDNSTNNAELSTTSDNTTNAAPTNNSVGTTTTHNDTNSNTTNKNPSNNINNDATANNKEPSQENVDNKQTTASTGKDTEMPSLNNNSASNNVVKTGDSSISNSKDGHNASAAKSTGDESKSEADGASDVNAENKNINNNNNSINNTDINDRSNNNDDNKNPTNEVAEVVDSINPIQSTYDADPLKKDSVQPVSDDPPYEVVNDVVKHADSGETHVAKKALFSKTHMNKDAPSETYVAKKASPSETHVAKEAPSSETHVAKEAPSSETHVAKETSSSETHLAKEAPSLETHVAKEALPTETHVVNEAPSLETHVAKEDPLTTSLQNQASLSKTVFTPPTKLTPSNKKGEMSTHFNKNVVQVKREMVKQVADICITQNAECNKTDALLNAATSTIRETLTPLNVDCGVPSKAPTSASVQHQALSCSVDQTVVKPNLKGRGSNSGQAFQVNVEKTKNLTVKKPIGPHFDSAANKIDEKKVVMSKSSNPPLLSKTLQTTDQKPSSTNNTPTSITHTTSMNSHTESATKRKQQDAPGLSSSIATSFITHQPPTTSLPDVTIFTKPITTTTFGTQNPMVSQSQPNHTELDILNQSSTELAHIPLDTMNQPTNTTHTSPPTINKPPKPTHTPFSIINQAPKASQTPFSLINQPSKPSNGRSLWSHKSSPMSNNLPQALEDSLKIFGSSEDWEIVEKYKNKGQRSTQVRESILIKFDPLASSQTSSTEHPSTACNSTTEPVETNPHKTTEDKMPLKEEDEDMVDGILSVSINPSPAENELIPVESMETKTQQPPKTPLLVDLLKYSEQDVARMKEEWEQKMQHKLKIMQEAHTKEMEDAKKDASNKVVEEYTIKLSNMANDYEQNIISLINEKERNQEEIMGLREERNQALKDTESLENSFADLHSRFMRSKSCVENYMENEKRLKEHSSHLVSEINKLKDQHEAFKMKAEDVIKGANSKLETLKSDSEREILLLKTLAKKSELKIKNLESNLQQKEGENKELMAMLDELLAKKTKET